MFRMASVRRSLAPFLVVAALGPAACSGEASARDSRLHVVAAFYPLEYVAARVGGPDTLVHGLTRPGAEPHDLELTPREVARVADADLVVHLADFQPAVDDAARTVAKGRSLDVAPAAHLDLRAGGGTDVDPHFWLDPTRLGAVATVVAERLAAVDPAHAQGYRQRAATLGSDLTGLDAALRGGLARCRSRDLVTGHEAFGYLARRYGLRQIGVTGLDPEAEPDPGALARVADLARARGVRTVYSEALVPADVSRAVAREAGASVAVLDPVESRPEGPGADYLSAMRTDLDVLRKGQECS